MEVKTEVIGYCTYCKEVITTNTVYLHDQCVGVFHVSCYNRYKEVTKIKDELPTEGDTRPEADK